MSGCDQESYYKSGIYLFRMVIFRAQQEASGDYRPTSEEVESHEEIIRGATQWLTEDSQDFRIVCHLAGLESDDLLPIMRRKYGWDGIDNV